MDSMDTEPFVNDTERELRILSSALTAPHERECLLCYVYRMLEHGCTGLRWALHYRDLRAPRATALADRLGQKGGYCDCEIFMNAYQPVQELWSPGREEDEGGLTFWVDPEPPEALPLCRGVRAGSTKGCTLWVRQWRGGW